MSGAALVLATLLALPGAQASHPSRQVTLRANLDADAAAERVVATEDSSVDHSEISARVVIVDRCRGRERTLPVVGARAALLGARLFQADDRGRPEVLAAVGGPLGAVGVGAAKVVRLVSGRGCPRLRTLFAYSASSPPLPAPDGYALSSFEAGADEVERGHRGRELTLVEWYRTGAALSSRVRTSVYRYSAARGRYVLLRTFVATVP